MRSKRLTTVASETLGDSAIQVEVTLPVRPRRHESRNGGQPDSVPDAGSQPGVPRIARLMALAIKFQDMVDRGEVRDYADLARLGYVTRARITQIMNMLNLAPNIQEEILGLDASVEHATPTERQIRSIEKIVPWASQRRAWTGSRDGSAPRSLEPIQ